MQSSGILCRVTLIRTDVSEELVKANVVLSLSIRVTLMMEGLSSYETSDLSRATRRDIPEDCIIYSQSRENLKSYQSGTVQMTQSWICCLDIEVVSKIIQTPSMFIYMTLG
jgi:hypothetical protein